MPIPPWIDRLVRRAGRVMTAAPGRRKKLRPRRDENDYIRLGLTRLEDRVVLDGAAVVSDLNPGTPSSTPTEQIEFGGSVYFSAEGADGNGQSVGRELYRLDADGSVSLVADINQGAAGSDPADFALFNGNLVFAATGANGRELYQIDASGNISLVADVNPGTASSNPEVLYEFSDKLYFSATGSAGRELYVVNRGGSASLIADINPAGDSNPSDFVEFDGNLYFVATGPNGRILYRESPSGTSDPEPIDLGVGVTDPQGFTEFNGALYFSALDPTDGRELFALTTGKQNASVVTKIANLDGAATSSSPDGFYVFEDHLYFAATAQNGREMFRLDAAGNIIQIDVAPGAESSSPVSFTEFDGDLYFAATVDGQRGLYRLDTSVATPRAASVPLPAGVALPDEARLYALGEELFFAADGPQGRELYRLDLAGVVTLAADIYPGAGSSDPTDLRLFAGEIYFVASDPLVGRELFRLLRDPSSLRVVGDTLVFTDENGDKDNRLLVYSDGVNLTIRDENGHDIALLTTIVGVSGGGTSEVVIPLASLAGVTVLEINARGGNDSVTFDLSTHAAAFFAQFETATYDGGPNSPDQRGDRLRFVGDGVITSSYTPDAAVPGSGVVLVSGGSGFTTFTFENLEPVEFTRMAEARLVTPLTADGVDLLTISEGVDSLDGIADVLIVSGTVGGTSIESGYFFANTTVVIATSAGVDGADQITVAGAANDHQNVNLVIDTGASGADNVVVADAVNLDGELTVRTYLIDVRAILTLGGDASLVARDDIQFAFSGQLLAQSAGSIEVTLLADADGAGGGGIALAAGSLVHAGSGTITLTATDDIQLGRLVTASGTAVAVLVRSIEGQILAGADTGAPNITAEASGAVVTLQAAGGMGTAANPLNLAVRNLIARTADGDQYLHELDDLASLDLDAGTRSIWLVAGGTIQDSDGAVDIRAAELTLQAAAAGAWLNPLQTELTTLSATAASGDLYFQELDGLTVLSITATSPAGNVGIVSLSGDVQVTQMVVSNLVTLWAQAGAIQSAGSATIQVTADDLELSAATGIGAAVAPLAVQVQRLEAAAGTGGIYLSTPSSMQVGGISSSLLNLTGLSAAGSVIALTSGGSVTAVETIATMGNGAIRVAAAVNLSLDAAVEAESGSVDLITGRALVLLVGSSVTTASGSIRLQANTGDAPTPGSFSGITLDGATITSSSGAIALVARSGDGGADLAGIELRGNSSVTSAAGSISVTGTSRGTSTGSDGVRLLDGSLIATSGPGEVSVSGTSGAVGHGVFLQDASTIGATGSGDVLITGEGRGGLADIAWDSLTIQKTGGDYTFQDGIAGGQLIALPGDYRVLFLDGGAIVAPVEFQNTGGVVLGNEDSDTLTFVGGMTSTSGPTTLQGTLITDGAALNLGVTKLVSTVTLLTAGGDITIGAVAGAGVPLTIHAGSGDVSLANPANVVGDLIVTADQLTLVEADDITQAAAWTTSGLTTLNAGTNDIVLTRPGNVLGTLQLIGANIAVVEAGDMEVGPSEFSGNFNLGSSGNLTVTGAITGSGTAQLVTNGHVAFAAAGSLFARSATSVDVTVRADADGQGGGGIVLADGAVIDSGAGTIALTATGDIVLGRLVTTNDGPAAVQLTSLAGAVLDGDSSVDIVAGSLVLTAQAAGTGDNPLQTQIGAVTANLTAGNLYLVETDGLKIVQVEALATGGSVAIASLAGDITVQRLAADSLVSLQSVQGGVLKAGAEQVTIAASSLEIAAATGIGSAVVPLLAAIDRLEAAGGSGGIFLRDSGDLQVGGMGAGSRLGLTGLSVTSAGVLDVRAGRDLSLKESVSSAAGAITLAAGRSIIGSAVGDLHTSSGAILLLADSDAAGGGTIQLAGDISLGSGRAVFSLPDPNGLVSGTIQGTGGIVKQGSGTLTLAATSQNTYTGATDVLAGTLRVDGAIGAAGPAQRVTISGGATLTGGGDVNAPVFASATTSKIVSSGNLRLGDGSTSGFQFAGEFSVRGSHSVVLRDADLAELGVLTAIESGGRLVADNGVQVGSGDRLVGSGAVAGNVIVLSGGQVSPGASAGTLSTNVGDVELQPNAAYVAEINGLQPGSGYDQLNVQGEVSVEGAVLQLAGGRFQPADGTVFTLVANDGTDTVSGVFRDSNGNLLAEGATVRFGGIEAEISYVGGPGGNDITLTVVDSVFIRNPTDSPLAGAATLVVNDDRYLPPRTTATTLVVVETTQSVRNSDSIDSRPAAIEMRTADRLRVFFRIVNEGTGQEEPKEFDLDPSVLRDVLGVFRRFRFQDGRYRIYIHEPGKSERLILDVNIVEGKVVPPNFRDAEVPGDSVNPQNPGADQGSEESADAPARKASAPVGEGAASQGAIPQGERAEPQNEGAGPGGQIPGRPIPEDDAPAGESASWLVPSTLAVGMVAASPAWRARVHAMLTDEDIPRTRFARMLRRIRPR